MKNLCRQSLAFIFVAFIAPLFGFSQNSTAKPDYEVYKIYPPLSITKEKLNEAQTLVDLNKYYKSSWVKEFVSVEVLASQNGKIRQVVAKNDVFNQEQKNIMNMADVGTDIIVKVRYIPDNTLKHNGIKEFDFTFVIEPEYEAKYPGGQQALMQYLKEKAINKIPDGIFNNYDLAIIEFTINEEGKTTDVQVFDSLYQTFSNEETEQLLLETISNMPRWKPAQYGNETKVKQEFALVVGNMESCTLNLINTRRFN